MFMRLAILATVFGGLLSGCQSGGGTLYGENYQAFYSPSLVNYAAREGYMPVAVYGHPFGPNSGEQVASNLRMPGGHVQVPFAATPKAQSGEDGRVVLLFAGAGPAPGGDTLCRMTHDTPPAAARGGKLSVMAAFCHGDGLASEVELVTARPGSPADPAFKNAMQVMLSRLLPTHDPNRDSDCPSALTGC
ncbi:MAG: hypothetical protein RIM84_01175 [Alphaproteobacteria bacterium]